MTADTPDRTPSLAEALLLERCRAFVQEQSCGEWTDALVNEDAAKMAVFVREQAEALAAAQQTAAPEASPAGAEELYQECCFACGEPFKEGDLYLSDASGGFLHTACCGPERECYVGPDGEPLGPDDPIPQGAVWTNDVSPPSAATPAAAGESGELREEGQ